MKRMIGLPLVALSLLGGPVLAKELKFDFDALTYPDNMPGHLVARAVDESESRRKITCEYYVFGYNMYLGAYEGTLTSEKKTDIKDVKDAVRSFCLDHYANRQ